jgi:tRNA-2-methylthio-N6-dimethylallyladenosine synthase
MNVHDSEKAESVLAEIGFSPVREPAEAELILLNTCMVREKAARKVYSRIHEIKSRIRKTEGVRRTPIFGVMGCVAQAEADRLFEQSRDVKLVMGTQAIGKLPSLLGQLEEGFARAIDVRLSKDADFLELDADRRNTKHIAYITITEGCNKFCSFCIVPFTRGRERSRPANRILEEAIALRREGFQEIQLLGQNVNSYGLGGKALGSAAPIDIAEGAGGDRSVSFAQLLELVASESGVPRIKYTTSYPRDFDQEIVRVMERHDNLCEWVHLPAQSGSDRILRAMRRGYTRAEYLTKIEMIKRATKDYSITGDIIIGFPGETDEDFLETMSLIAEVGYDGLFIFKYSARPKTPAAALTDTVSEEVMSERFTKLLELQDRIQRGRYERFLGRDVEVLVEGTSTRSDADLTGHTRCNKIVNFPSSTSVGAPFNEKTKPGDIVKIRITEVKSHSLYGHLN